MEIKEQPKEHVVGHGDGDDPDDLDDELFEFQMKTTYAAEFMATVASARMHGLSFEEIGKLFHTQMTGIAIAEKTVLAGVSREEAEKAVIRGVRRSHDTSDDGTPSS